MSSISLSSIASLLAQTYAEVKGVAAEAKPLYELAAGLMQTFETTFAAAENAGAAKKAAVLAAVGVVATQAGQDWNTLEAELGAFIDGVKGAYNLVTAAFSKITNPGA